ncbi:MAG TPA: MarR family transcriptional regulator [Xanthobacteraceae bacterium]|nr:MarR family transcriptional regulator [Xanthobacteraceae bacterium]
MAALEQALRDVSGTGVLFSQAAAERLGLNSTDLECLGVIASGPATAGELAQATGLTTGAITGVIDRLERAGYARREHDRVDRRKVRVRAQAEALAKTGPIFEPMRRASAEVLSRYSDAELALILDFLTRAQTASVKVVAALRKQPKTKGRSR